MFVAVWDEETPVDVLQKEAKTAAEDTKKKKLMMMSV